jgi:hypothetical protein
MTTRIFIAFLSVCPLVFSQQEEIPEKYTLDANYFYGSIILHNPDISHLIMEHPSGFILGFNKKTFGHKDWESGYNYPDTGFSFTYQDFNNSTLGSNYGLYAH